MRIPKVLVVNDHAASLQVLESILSEGAAAGEYELVTARSKAEALRQTLQHDFAVILMHDSMPGMDGFEISEAIHSHQRSASVPIIFLSERHADQMHLLEGYRKGAVDYLSIPVIPHFLRAKVAVFVELAKKNLQLTQQADELSQLNHSLQAQRREDLQHIAERKTAEEALRQSREELRLLANYLERAKEDERKRIAREIHDELGQNLLALRIDISILHTRTGVTHPKLHAKVGSVLDQIDATIKNMRTIINNLRPAVLDLGLHAAIEWQVREFRRRSGIECRLKLDRSELDLDDNCATALFRILQESLSNVIRHARASCVDVELHREGGLLLMKVADNGIGVFPDCRRKANSFGLVGIKERVNHLGGELTIETGCDRGMALTISIPTDNIVPVPMPQADAIILDKITSHGANPANSPVAKGPFKFRRKKVANRPAP